MADAFGTPLTKPASQLREYVTVLRTGLHDGVVSFDGEFYHVDTPLPERALIPVTVAAVGPNMFAVAGEVADAAMSWMAPFEYLDRVAVPAVERGAAASGRRPPPVVSHITAIVGAEGTAARDVARPAMAVFAHNRQYATMFAAAGMPVREDGNVSDTLIDAVTVSGDETTLTDRLGALADQRGELLVTLETAGDRRDGEDVMFRVLGNLRRSFAESR